MNKSEEFAEDVKNKMEHDAPYIWLHLVYQKEEGFDYIVFPEQDMIRKEDFISFITKEDAKEYLRNEHSTDNPLLMYPISKITEALAPLVENELNDFFDRDLGKGRGKMSDQEMDR